MNNKATTKEIKKDENTDVDLQESIKADEIVDKIMSKILKIK